MDFLRGNEPFQGVTPTPRVFFHFLRPFPPLKGPRAAWAPRVRIDLYVVSLVFISSSSGLSSEVKGWRLFMIADAWASFVRLAAAEPMSAKREPQGPRIPGSMPGDQDLRTKTGRSIRCPARNSPAKRARTGFEPLGIADGRQPFMPRVSHNPCLLMLPFRFAHAMRMRPLSVGRVESAFHPARCHYGNVHTFCKENATKIFSLLYRSGPGTAPRYRLGYQGQRPIARSSRRPLRVACRTRTTQWETAARKHRVHSPMAWRTCRSCHPSCQRLKTPESGNSSYGTFPRPSGCGPGAPVSATMRSLRAPGSARRGGRTSENDKGRRWTPCSSKRRLRC